MTADITMQMRHITTGLRVQLAAHDAPIGAGVVHGVSDTTPAQPAKTRRAVSQHRVDHRYADEGDKHHRVHDDRRPEQNRLVDIKEARHDAHLADGAQMGGPATQQQEGQRQGRTDAANQQIVIPEALQVDVRQYRASRQRRPGLPTGWPSRTGS